MAVSSIPETIKIYGSGYILGTYCLLDNKYKLITTFISETELHCKTPVHIPGIVQISIVNPFNGYKSDQLELKFIDKPPQMISYSSGGISPLHGPKVGGTIITVLGSGFLSITKVLLCQINQDWVYAAIVSDTKVRCLTPFNSYSGQVIIRLATDDKVYLPGQSIFEYIEDPSLYSVEPQYGTVGALVQLRGKGFLRIPSSDYECFFGEINATVAVINDKLITCIVPEMNPGKYTVTLRTNGQQYLKSGLIFKYNQQAILDSISPPNGPALRGNTIITIIGSGFPLLIDVYCVLGEDYLSVPAIVLSENMLRCRLPSHKPGKVNITIVAEGSRLHSNDNILEFLYTPDVSVDKISPPFGYTCGGYPVFIFGTNFINTTFLGCKFGDMLSRGIFLSNTSILCLAPSPLGRSEIRTTYVGVDVTLNGIDYSENHIPFLYSEPCDEGWFCPGMTRQLCPNGTYCPSGSRNFTLCPPGFFQPKEGQVTCVSCPVGYICPDHGMSRPMICPAGQICDTQGLRASSKNCPMGHYCLNGTKSSLASQFLNNTRFNIPKNVWFEEYVTGVVSFNPLLINWNYTLWPLPAVGKSRPNHPPEPHCDGMVCTPGSLNVIAEAPFPCPIGHYCRAGVAAQFPIPKNFSTPQRCFDGFFCPRGSINPEGSGPCPTGYFCPTQLDAIICPRGHYCPGVGNRGPIECYPGTYNPSEGRSNCTVCPTGHVCPGWGSLLPEICPAGFVCSSLGLSFPVVLCPAGYICDDGTLTLDPSDPTPLRPKPCQAGTFCLGGVSRDIAIPWVALTPWGAQTPQDCSEGTYCKTGAYQASGSGQCFKGHYCPPRVEFPIETPIGTFASEEGAVAPTLCFPGTYAPLKAQIDCDPCPAGHSCQNYGTYIPTICGIGSFRSLVDSVTCRLCITGTYSDEIGAVDISMCLPCPEGRVCGVLGIHNLSLSVVCPNGHICGYGTDRTRQFTHLAPAGYHTPIETIPSEQYDRKCSEGYYCVRGTSTLLAQRSKCGVGYYCPNGTSNAAGYEVKCPRVTTSLSGVKQISDCRVSDVDVCDKAAYDIRYPMEDITYYPTFSYTLLDGSGEEITYDSSTTAISTTGEIQVVNKIYSINESSSSLPWVNETVEVFRPCPSFGNADPTVSNIVTIIGRNFRDTGLNYCRWRRCISSNSGGLPRRCKNIGTTKDGSDYPKFGLIANETQITIGKFISKTRIECEVPKFYFEYPIVIPDYLKDICIYYKSETDISSTPAVLGYVRECDDLDETVCMNEPNVGENIYTTLVLPCTTTEISSSLCSNKPELNYMFNPCFTNEMTVEVTNDGFHYSGGDDLSTRIIPVTVIDSNDRKTRYLDYEIEPTAGIFTFIRKEYYPDEEEILNMEKEFCLLPTYAEESIREREKGWFALEAHEVAHIHIDVKHLPPDLIYGEHYRFALFMFPSRCNEESCNSNRVRLSPRETLPCKLPASFSTWFLDESVQKNTTNNITVIALEDLIFKIEVHILVGLFAPYAPLFENCTTVRIASPSRSRVQDGLPKPTNRILSPYISYETRIVPHKYLFAMAYSRSYADSISYPLNLPPRGSEYKYGRALISYNTSADAVDIPDVLDDFSSISIGSKFWDSPASTADEAKEIYDTFFETFHGMTYVKGVYTEYFTEILVPYMLYFSNCRTFDSYIPFWLLTEGKECVLPSEQSVGADWPRFAYPPLPDQDDIKVVGPWAFFEDPIADWCHRSLVCNYEESLDTLDVVPRWFEAATGDTLFTIIREPLTYAQFAGRGTPFVGEKDAGGQAAFDKLEAISSDIFIGVSVDREAAASYPGGCTLGCFPRRMILDIGYYQLDILEKRLIYVNLIYEEFDKNTSDTHYDLNVKFYPLGYYDLLIFFCFDVEIFIILFAFVGGVTVASAFAYWFVVRITTGLQNPPELKVYSMFTLVAPPPAAGVTLALIPIVMMTFAAYYLIAGDQLVDPTAPAEGWLLDSYQLSYSNIGGRLDPETVATGRSGRLGLSFIFIGWYCLWIGCHIFLPKKVSKREDELALKRDKMAEKEEIWAPTLWKRSNLMFSSIMMALFLVFLVEFSFWGSFGDYIWYVIFILFVIGQITEAIIENQLSEALLCAPLKASFGIVQGLVTLGADNFVDFILSYFIELALNALERVYIGPGLDNFLDYASEVTEETIEYVKGFLPSFLKSKKKKEEELDFRKREVDDEIGEDAETVEPILDAFGGVCEDTMGLWYTPFLTWLLMQFRTQIVLPELYGIREQDMLYYLYFALVIIFFQVITDILLHSCCELFHGWKIYEYLVYTRYRFLQRETRWKGMETALDECIDESMRTLDQMCFSSQYFLMLTIHTNGIIYIILGIEMMLRAEYNPFSDTAFAIILAYLWACYLFLSRFLLWFVIKIKLWKIKHENTAWHLQVEDEDDLDVPGWEDVKGASHDAYLMNQRITSETFRYKFLNYNRAWLIQQLPQLLTPRTLRRSRPYLINQFARILNSRRDDISDDSEGEKDKKFGPVALQASSRNIIRFWLDKARRRLRLKHIVEPLIRRARGAECEQCLSRKQLQVEYEVDIDQMIQMYENFFPADVEIDQVQWKTFWMRNQHYHTICMTCIAKRKDKNRDIARSGKPELARLDDEIEDYPDWGPVYLSAPSKAILLNWLRQARTLRAGKKGRKKDKDREKIAKVVSDDEGDDVPRDWVKEVAKLTPATKAIAVKWMRTARARLQKKAGKGGEIPTLSDTFKSGNKSRLKKK